MTVSDDLIGPIPDDVGDLIADTAPPTTLDEYDYLFDPAETVLRQLPGESDYRFQMLKRVAELPPHERTSRKIGALLGIHPNNVRRARSQWKWTERLRKVEAAQDLQRAAIIQCARADAARELGAAFVATAALARRTAEGLDPSTVSPSSVAQLLGAVSRAFEMIAPTDDELMRRQLTEAIESESLSTDEDDTATMLRGLARRPDLLEDLVELRRSMKPSRPT